MSETVDPVSGNITAILAPEDYFSYGLRDVFLGAFITEVHTFRLPNAHSYLIAMSILGLHGW
jgi:hypothetical protein